MATDRRTPAERAEAIKRLVKSVGAVVGKAQTSARDLTESEQERVTALLDRIEALTALQVAATRPAAKDTPRRAEALARLAAIRGLDG